MLAYEDMADVAPTSTGTGPIRLSEREDAARQVVVHPENDDLFVLTGRQAIDGCRLGISLKVWLDELDAMSGFVAEWCDAHRDQVDRCALVPRSGNLLLFVSPTSPQFDFDLADAMVDLDLTVSRQFRLGRVEVQQVPERELERFVDADKGRQLWPR